MKKTIELGGARENIMKTNKVTYCDAIADKIINTFKFGGDTGGGIAMFPTLMECEKQDIAPIKLELDLDERGCLNSYKKTITVSDYNGTKYKITVDRITE